MRGDKGEENGIPDVAALFMGKGILRGGRRWPLEAERAIDLRWCANSGADCECSCAALFGGSEEMSGVLQDEGVERSALERKCGGETGAMTGIAAFKVEKLSSFL